MPDLKNIPSHADWSTFKKNHKQDKFSVSGVDLGSSLDAYKAAVRLGTKALPANVAAAKTLHDTLTKYISKMPKDPKRPADFDKGVAAIRDNARHNLDAYLAEQHELAQFSQVLQKFHSEVVRLTAAPGLKTLDEVKKDQLLPPLLAAAKKLDLDDYILDEVHGFRKSRDEILRMAAAKNPAAAFGELADMRAHADKIVHNLQTVLAG